MPGSCSSTTSALIIGWAGDHGGEKIGPLSVCACTYIATSAIENNQVIFSRKKNVLFMTAHQNPFDWEILH